MAWPNRWSWSNAVAQKGRGGGGGGMSWGEQLAQGTWGQLANWPAATSPGGSAPGYVPAPAPAPAAEAPAAVEPTPATPAPTHYMDSFKAFFANLGMTMSADLEGILQNAITNLGYTGTESDVAILMPEIENTESFKARFVGYAAYKANHNGTALGLQQYINLELGYEDVMRRYGLPAGFYDDASDFGTFIANGTSVDEIERRVKMATDLAKQVDPTMRNLLSTFYGVGTGDVAAYYLDPARAEATIAHQYQTAEVAQWAVRNGYAIDSMSRFEQLLADGVTAQQAAQGYGTIRALDDAVGAAASVYGDTYDQTDAERDVFFGDNEKRRKIMAKEQATFGGSTSGQQGTVRRTSY